MVSLLSAVRRFGRLLCVCVSTLTLLECSGFAHSNQANEASLLLTATPSPTHFDQQYQQRRTMTTATAKAGASLSSLLSHVWELWQQILQETYDKKNFVSDSSGDMWQQNFVSKFFRNHVTAKLFSKFLRKHVTANSSGSNWQQILQQIFEETFG